MVDNDYWLHATQLGLWKRLPGGGTRDVDMAVGMWGPRRGSEVGSLDFCFDFYAFVSSLQK